MAIYLGERKAALFRGDCRPAELYRGNQKIAGYDVIEYLGNNILVIPNTYNDTLYLKIYGYEGNESSSFELKVGDTIAIISTLLQSSDYIEISNDTVLLFKDGIMTDITGDVLGKSLLKLRTTYPSTNISASDKKITFDVRVKRF